LCVVVSRDCLSIASGDRGGKIVVHSVADGTVLKEIQAHDWIRQISFSRDGSRLVSGSNDRMCKVWDTKEWIMLKEIAHPRDVLTVQFTEDDRIVTGCYDGVIRTFDATYEQVEDKAGKVGGIYAAENNGWKAVADGNVVKMVDTEGIAIWASRNYLLTLKDSDITDAKELTERNKLLWEQHNPKTEK